MNIDKTFECYMSRRGAHIISNRRNPKDERLHDQFIQKIVLENYTVVFSSPSNLCCKLLFKCHDDDGGEITGRLQRIIVMIYAYIDAANV